MRNGGDPDPVIQFHIDPGVGESGQRAEPDPGIVFDGVGLGILSHPMERGLEFPPKLSAQSDPLSLVEVQRLAQFGLGVCVQGDGLHG
jgi:hypothetical protein